MTATKTRRLQVMIEEPQWTRLKAQAAARGVSVASLVREAIDTVLAGGAQSRAAAARAILDGVPMAVPDPLELRQEVDEFRGHRA